MGVLTGEGELCVYDMRQRLKQGLADAEPALKTQCDLGMLAIVNEKDESLILVGKGELSVCDLKTKTKKYQGNYSQDDNKQKI